MTNFIHISWGTSTRYSKAIIYQNKDPPLLGRVGTIRNPWDVKAAIYANKSQVATKEPSLRNLPNYKAKVLLKSLYVIQISVYRTLA